MNATDYWMGLRIHVSPDRARMTLNPDLGNGVTYPPGFKAEIDSWLRRFFGTTNLIPDGQSLRPAARCAHEPSHLCRIPRSRGAGPARRGALDQLTSK